MSVFLNAIFVDKRWVPSKLAFSVMGECCTAFLGFLWIFCICADWGKAAFPSLTFLIVLSERIFLPNWVTNMFFFLSRNETFLSSLCSQCEHGRLASKNTSSSLSGLAVYSPLQPHTLQGHPKPLFSWSAGTEPAQEQALESALMNDCTAWSSNHFILGECENPVESREMLHCSTGHSVHTWTIEAVSQCRVWQLNKFVKKKITV